MRCSTDPHEVRSLLSGDSLEVELTGGSLKSCLYLLYPFLPFQCLLTSSLLASSCLLHNVCSGARSQLWVTDSSTQVFIYLFSYPALISVTQRASGACLKCLPACTPSPCHLQSKRREKERGHIVDLRDERALAVSWKIAHWAQHPVPPSSVARLKMCWPTELKDVDSFLQPGTLC